MSAKIYQFPDFNVEGYPQFNIEEIDLQYEQYYQWEQDEYIFNQLLKREQDQNEQKKEQACFAHKLVRQMSFNIPLKIYYHG